MVGGGGRVGVLVAVAVAVAVVRLPWPVAVAVAVAVGEALVQEPRRRHDGRRRRLAARVPVAVANSWSGAPTAAGGVKSVCWADEM